MLSAKNDGPSGGQRPEEKRQDDEVKNPSQGMFRKAVSEAEISREFSYQSQRLSSVTKSFFFY